MNEHAYTTGSGGMGGRMSAERAPTPLSQPALDVARERLEGIVKSAQFSADRVCQFADSAQGARPTEANGNKIGARSGRIGAVLDLADALEQAMSRLSDEIDRLSTI